MNGFGPEPDSNEGGQVARRGPHIQLMFKLGQKGELGQKEPISY